ncbi:DUF3618 domain-containing protein [Spirillospora sp. CA-108201]
MTMQGRHGAEAGTEELRQEVDRARHELGETVEQLAAKADVKAMAREKVEQARGRARDTATSAWGAASSREGKAKAFRGGAVIASAGAIALGAVWLRRRRTSPPTSRMRLGRGGRPPVQVRMRVGQRRAVTVRRTGRR